MSNVNNTLDCAKEFEPDIDNEGYQDSESENGSENNTDVRLESYREYLTDLSRNNLE